MASLVLKISCVILFLTCVTWVSGGQSCRKCPQYWMQVGSYCYRYFGNGRRWHDADTVCRNAGAHLPSIHSRTEEAALYQLWKGLAKDPTRDDDAYWLGLRDTHREGRFTWTDGTSTDYTNWRSGEPNNVDHGEDCVEVRNIGVHDDDRMKWNDQPCDLSLSFFCRKPLPTPIVLPPFE